jgi:hypothetical protein
MLWSAAELAAARETISALLEELGLAAYVFAIEPREGEWELKVECDITDAWETVTMPVEVQALLASRTDAEVRKGLLQKWNARLTACRRSERRKS